MMTFSQDKAAREMHISRATFGRIVESARRKVADAILNGKAVRINENWQQNYIVKEKQDVR